MAAPHGVAGLPAHGIAVRTYVTCMFEYGKGYSGAGTDTPRQCHGSS